MVGTVGLQTSPFPPRLTSSLPRMPFWNAGHFLSLYASLGAPRITQPAH